jgi:hypothetical protein
MQDGEDLPLSLSARWQLKGCECAPRTARIDGAPIAIVRDPSTKRIVELPTVVRISPAVVITGLWHVAAMIAGTRFPAIELCQFPRCENRCHDSERGASNFVHLPSTCLSAHGNDILKPH